MSGQLRLGEQTDFFQADQQEEETGVLKQVAVPPQRLILRGSWLFEYAGANESLSRKSNRIAIPSKQERWGEWQLPTTTKR